MREWVIVSVVLAAALAGCAEGERPVQAEDEFGEELNQELKATSTTGVIRGVVVDDAIVPVPGALVRIDALGREATTNDNGQFGFSDLEPGTYFLGASKVGFLKAQQSVAVEAGVENPPVARVLLQRDATFNPYWEVLQHAGFYQCGTSVVVLCAAPNIVFGEGTTADSSTPTYYWDVTPDFIQTEMVWESTQALSPALYFEMEALDGPCDGDTFLENAEGESPIRTRVNRTVLDDSTIGGDCGIYYSVFSGDAVGPVGFSIEQRFEWFITSYYSYEPPEEWWYINDGGYEPPS